jgi:hypothetical protein
MKPKLRFYRGVWHCWMDPYYGVGVGNTPCDAYGTWRKCWASS